MSHDTDVVRAGALLRKARHAIVLTGAGISTPSGIPDFRSPGSGLWESVNPFVVASIIGFRLHPKAFYDWVRPLAAKAFAAEPESQFCCLRQGFAQIARQEKSLLSLRYLR